MKTSTPIAFAFEESAVRVVPNGNTPVFVAKDVCAVLGIANHRDAISSLDDDEVGCVGIPDAMGRIRETNVLTESGLYALVFRSNKPEAKRFRKWVTSEVLPSIRKTGGYGILTAADEIRYMNQRLSLLRELRHERDPLLREKLHEQFKTVSDRLGYETPALAAFAPPDPNDGLDERTRQIIARFWAAVDTLEQLGIAMNHSRAPNQIAVNLNEALRLAEEHGVAMPGRIELLRALPQCCEPHFMAASYPLTSNLRGKTPTVRCYLFRKDAA